MTITQHKSTLVTKNLIGELKNQAVLEEQVVSDSHNNRPVKVLVIEENQPEYAPWYQVISTGVNTDQFEAERAAAQKNLSASNQSNSKAHQLISFCI